MKFLNAIFDNKGVSFNLSIIFQISKIIWQIAKEIVDFCKIDFRLSLNVIKEKINAKRDKEYTPNIK